MFYMWTHEPCNVTNLREQKVNVRFCVAIIGFRAGLR